MTQLSVYAMDFAEMDYEPEMGCVSATTSAQQLLRENELLSSKEAQLLLKELLTRETLLRQKLVKLYTEGNRLIATFEIDYKYYMWDIAGCDYVWNEDERYGKLLVKQFSLLMHDVMVLLKDPSYAMLKLAKQFLAAVKANEDEQQTAFAKLGPSHTYSPSELFGTSLMTFLNSL